MILCTYDKCALGRGIIDFLKEIFKPMQSLKINPVILSKIKK